MPAASVLPPRPATSQQRTWTPPALRSEGRARLLLQKGSEMFVQVGVGRPAGVGRRRPVGGASTRGLTPFFRGAKVCSQVDPLASRWVAGTGGGEGIGPGVLGSGVGPSCGGCAGSPWKPESSSYPSSGAFEGSHLLLPGLSRPASFSRTVLSPPLPGDPGSGRLPTFSPPLLVNFLFGSSGAPGSLIPGSLERFTNIN